MKETIIIWSIITLVVFSLLVPPYGYTRISVTNIPKGAEVMTWESNEVVPWTYVCHRFIFSAPPHQDPDLKKRCKRDDPLFEIARVVDMRISWSSVLIEIAAIITVGMGMIFIMRTQKRRVDN